MRQTGLQLDVTTFSALISACERDHQGWRAFDFLAEMRQTRLQPGVITFNASISACEKAISGNERSTSWQRRARQGYSWTLLPSAH